MKKVDFLQQDLEQQCDSVRIKGLPFIHTFRAFSTVVDSCFGVSVKPGYSDKIKAFKNSYLALEITVTLKVGFLFCVL